jgi:hypothetical protein
MYTIKLANDRTNLRAVKRFWYQVYCLEREVLLESADHGSGLLGDPLLHESNLFIAEDEEGICGTVMTTYSFRADLGEYVEFYQMTRFPTHPKTTSITKKLMVSRRYRGSRLGVQLACAAFDQALRDGITHNFIDCNRPLYKLFRGLGFREHCGWQDHPDFGEVCVMLLRLVEDQIFFERIRSPFARHAALEKCA